jgi:DNA repair protein RadC
MVKKFLKKVFSKEKTYILNEEDLPKTSSDEQKLKEIDFGKNNENKDINIAQEPKQAKFETHNKKQELILDDITIAKLIKKTAIKNGPKKIEKTIDWNSQSNTETNNITFEEKNVKQKQKNILQTEKKEEIKHYQGHRLRLRNKVIENGPTILKDYELLELLLTYSIPRADVKPLAKTLLIQFKTFQNLFLSDMQTKKNISGLGESSLCFLSIIHEVCCRMAKEEIIDQILLDTPEKVINYCRLRMSGLNYEQFKVLFLNRKNKLIVDEIIQSGTLDKAAIFPRELIKRAIDLAAGAIILVHNHPSGDPTPSKADIEVTANIQKAASLMEIFLYDHIIIGKNTHYSMRSNQLIS